MASANTRPDDYLGILLVGRTGQGKSTTGNKLLEAAGERVLRESKIDKFAVGEGEDSCTREIRSVFRPGIRPAKAVHVVDIPGFADTRTSEGSDVKKDNHGIFRDLIRVQTHEKMGIHRVLYFLPSRGPLERADAVLQEEIEVMHHFFGNDLFERMVLVATFHKQYQAELKEIDKKKTKRVFKAALKSASIGDDCPECPPLIFIGFADQGVDIQRMIENAPVVSNKVFLFDRFVDGTCSWCATKYVYHKGKPNIPKNRVGVVTYIYDKEQKCMKEEITPYESSKCHPLFILKYTFWERAAGGAAHVATLGIPALIGKLATGKLPWPFFTSKDEVCVKCKKGPGSNGCWKVREHLLVTLPTEKIKNTFVDHTNEIKDLRTEYSPCD